MKMNDFILFGQPHIGKDEINEVIESLENGWLGTGPKTKNLRRTLLNTNPRSFL